MGEATRRAAQEVIAAREGLANEVDELGSAARSALDIPAKVRRHPARTAGLAGGAAFIVAGGPKRVLRGVGRRLRRKPPAPHSLLPPEIERAVADLGPDAAAVRVRLEREFAAYLEARGRDRAAEPGPTRSLWKLFDAAAGPLGQQIARRLVERFLAADPDRAPAGDATERAGRG